MQVSHWRLHGDTTHGYLLLIAFGELDLSSAAVLRADLLSALSQGCARLVIDLRRVSFVDCAVLDVLTEAQQLAAEKGGQVCLVAPQGAVRRVLELTGLTARFSIHATLGAAIPGGLPGSAERAWAAPNEASRQVAALLNHTSIEDQDPPATALADVALTLHGTDTGALFERTLELARKLLGGDHGGVLLVRSHGRMVTAAATDPAVERSDQIQAATGQGPCLSVFAGPNSGVLLTDTRTETRWPSWAAQATDLGLRSGICVRLASERTTVGALHLYAANAGAFSDADLEYARLFALHAGVALDAALNAAHLQTAITARHHIGQAQGILIERFGLDADQAFSVLRRYSQQGNVKLRDVAASLIRTGQLPDPPVQRSMSRARGGAGDPSGRSSRRRVVDR